MSFHIPVSEKLTRGNFLVWRAQVLPAVRGARLVGLLDGSYVQPTLVLTVKKADGTEEEKENPAYVQWIAQDQQVLSYLLSSVTNEILVQVSSLENTSEVWRAVTMMFSSQAKSRILQIKSQLSREKKGDQSAFAYYTKMKGFADEMAAAGKKLDDADIIDYILNGLDSDYNPFVSSLSVKDDVTLSDLYVFMASYSLLRLAYFSRIRTTIASIHQRTLLFVIVVMVVAADAALVVVLPPLAALLEIDRELLSKMRALFVNYVNALVILSTTAGIALIENLYLQAPVLVVLHPRPFRSRRLLLLLPMEWTPTGILIPEQLTILPMN